MKRLLSAVKYDMRFQYRHGFYHVYLLFTVLYAAVIRLVPEEARLPVAAIIVLSDPAVLGYFSIGALVMLERGQNLYAGVFSTPLRIDEYLVAKALSLGIISTASSLLIIVLGLGRMVNPVYVAAGVFLTAMFFTLAGFAPALQFKSLPVFLVISPLYIVVFNLPVLHYLGLVESVAFYLLPTTGALLLIDGSLTGLSAGQAAYSVIILVLWTLGAWQLARKVLVHYIIRGGGGKG